MVRLLVTTLEMRHAPQGPGRRTPRPDAAAAREWPTPEAYLALYRSVGAVLQWDERLRLDPKVLATLLADPSTVIFVLRVDGAAVGLCEAVREEAGSLELTNFGLMPEVQGQGLGPWLLETALRALWTPETRRIWLHTDTNDHPGAVPVYLRAGFEVVGRAWMDFPD